MAPLACSSGLCNLVRAKDFPTAPTMWNTPFCRAPNAPAPHQSAQPDRFCRQGKAHQPLETVFPAALSGKPSFLASPLRILLRSCLRPAIGSPAGLRPIKQPLPFLGSSHQWAAGFCSSSPGSASAFCFFAQKEQENRKCRQKRQYHNRI